MTFARHVDHMRNTIKEAFYRPTRRLSFAAAWIDKFLGPDYKYFCK